MLVKKVPRKDFHEMRLGTRVNPHRIRLELVCIPGVLSVAVVKKCAAIATNS